MTEQKSQLRRTVVVMMSTAFVSAAVLSLVYQITKEPIQEAQNRLIAESIKEVVTTEFDNNPFEEKINVKQGGKRFTLYPARKDGYVTSIIMKSFTNKGFGGRMDVLVSFRLDGVVDGYKVVRHKETPGLGSKVNDDSFREKIVGRRPDEDTFKVRQDGGEIDAMTGATITSRALIDAIQKAYRGYLKFNTGSENE